MNAARRRRVFLLGFAILAALLVGGRWVALETAERAWAATIARGNIYLTTRDLARLTNGIVLLIAVTWGTANLYYVYRAIGSVQLPRRLGDLEIVEAVPQRVLLAGTLACGIVYGLLLTLGTGDWWREALLASRPPSFGIADPVLHRDLGYYLGELPWAVTCKTFALVGTTTAALLVAGLYLGIGSLRFKGWRPDASAHARAHLGLVLALLGLTLVRAAVLDPAESVAGLHGDLDRRALEARIAGARLIQGTGCAGSRRHPDLGRARATPLAHCGVGHAVARLARRVRRDSRHYREPIPQRPSPGALRATGVRERVECSGAQRIHDGRGGIELTPGVGRRSGNHGRAPHTAMGLPRAGSWNRSGAPEIRGCESELAGGSGARGSRASGGRQCHSRRSELDRAASRAPRARWPTARGQ